MLIFLDFDGVVAHSKTAKNRYLAYPEQDADGTVKQTMWYDLDPTCIVLLNRLIKLTNAKVVISSAWRTWHSVANLEKHLKDFGFSGEVIGKTIRKFSSWRDQEIKWWMEENKYSGDYIILDDDIFELSKADRNHFVWIKHGWDQKGLRSKRAKWELIRVLRKRGIEWDHSF